LQFFNSIGTGVHCSCRAHTRNIRKPGIVGKFNFCTFTQNCNGLIGWSFEIPAYAYCQPLPTSLKKKTATWKLTRQHTTKTEKKEKSEWLPTTPADPIKFYFLPTHIFCFLRANPHCTHWQVAPADPQTKTCQRVQFF